MLLKWDTNLKNKMQFESGLTYQNSEFDDDIIYSVNLEPKKGSLVTFLSSPQSIHGVDKINNNKEKRYFFYGSYTSIKEIEWKKY